MSCSATERGAFAGAKRRKSLGGGDGGTVFLDEIGEMEPATQAKLLRVLESKEVMRLAALQPLPIDVGFDHVADAGHAAQAAEDEAGNRVVVLVG